MKTWHKWVDFEHSYNFYLSFKAAPSMQEAKMGKGRTEQGHLRLPVYLFKYGLQKSDNSIERDQFQARLQTI